MRGFIAHGRRSRSRASRSPGGPGQALRYRSGQAYTEFLLVLPGVLLLLFLAWEFAYFWWSRMAVSTAVFEGARTVAEGNDIAEGYAVYDQVLGGGAEERRGEFHIVASPEGDLAGLRSVRAEADMPYRWPTGLGALMGGGLSLELKASAFFRLEQFYPGPPEEFE